MARVNLSSLTAEQDFSSPDGLWFSRATGLCWIQTDDGAYTDVTNCMMLAGVPGTVVNIQHPGETISAANAAHPAADLSQWPGSVGYGAGGAMARPRSATIVITKDDGGWVGA